jgi:CRISPR-associated protein Cmr2
MSLWLLKLSFGPVQSFIAAARSSRDLWAGSRILSEIVRGSARHLIDAAAEQGAAAHPLIYPASAQIEQDVDAQGLSAGNLSNEILAQVEAVDESSLRRLVHGAQEAGRAVFARIAEAERLKWQQTLGQAELRRALWDAQVADAFVFNAAWVRLDDLAYDDRLRALKRMMAARKHSVTFAPHPLPPEFAQAGIPKSWLDGINESVVPESRDAAKQRFDLGQNEQLDALGCIKRSYGKSEKFTALTRLAADPWLRMLAESDPQTLRALDAVHRRLMGSDYATPCSGNRGRYAAFPYDAGLLFGGALAEAQARAGRDGDPETIAALTELDALLRGIRTRPNPYVALLFADGDGMGGFMGRATTQPQHARMSDAIAAFSAQVPVIARESGSHAIYHGGDDVLIACVLPTAIDCARELARVFAAHMQALKQALAEEGLVIAREDLPTLRVGIAICHVKEPMNFIRHNAASAERLAKGADRAPDRAAGRGNALGLRLHMRSGPAVEARLGFDTLQTGGDDFAAMQRWMQAYSGDRRSLPARTAFDLLEASVALSKLQGAVKADTAHASAGHPPTDDPPAEDPLDDVRRIGEAEFKRILARSRESGGERGIAAELRGALAQRLGDLRQRSADDPAQAMRMLGSELLLARWLSAASDDLLPERGDDR